MSVDTDEDETWTTHGYDQAREIDEDRFVPTQYSLIRTYTWPEYRMATIPATRYVKVEVNKEGKFVRKNIQDLVAKNQFRNADATKPEDHSHTNGTTNWVPYEIYVRHERNPVLSKCWTAISSNCYHKGSAPAIATAAW